MSLLDTKILWLGVYYHGRRVYPHLQRTVLPNTSNYIFTESAHCHIVPFRWFHRISGAPTETLPNFKYDAPEEVCGDRNLFDIPLKKLGLEQICDVNSSLTTAAAICCR